MTQVSWHIKLTVTERQEVAIGWWASSPLKFTLRQHKTTHLLVTPAWIWHMGDGSLGRDPMDLPTIATLFWINSFLGHESTDLLLSSVGGSGGFSRRHSVEDPKPFIFFQVVDLTGRSVDGQWQAYTFSHILPWLPSRLDTETRSKQSSCKTPWQGGDEVEKTPAAPPSCPPIHEALLHSIVPCVLAVGQIASSQLEIIIDLLCWEFS